MSPKGFTLRARWPIAAIALIAVAVAGLAVLWQALVNFERSRLVREWQGRLSAMADDRRTAVDAWLSERLGDAQQAAEFPDLVVACSRPRPWGGRAEASPEALDRVRSLLGSMLRGGHYDAIAVIGPEGAEIARVPPGLEPGAAELGLARECASSGRCGLAMVRSAGGMVVLTSTAAVRSRDGRAEGAVVLGADPDRWLYPLLLRQPVPTATGETLLVRAEGGDAVFLSPLRHGSRVPLDFRLPLSTPGLASAAAVTGQERATRYVDYRGVPVLAAARRVGVPGWGLVVKVDEAEALAPLGAWRRWLLLTLLLSAAAIAGVGYGVWRSRNAALLAELARGRASLAELLDHANDAILYISANGRILDGNRRAETFYGYELAELRQMSILDLQAPHERARAAAEVGGMTPPDSGVFETVHVRKDGSLVAVEASTRVMRVAGERAFLAIIRDVSERKAAEARIRFLNRLLHTITEISQLVVRERSRERVLAEACRVIVERGEFAMAWVGFADAATGTVRPVASSGDSENYLQTITVRFDESALGRGPTGTAVRESRVVVVDDWAQDQRIAPWKDAGNRRGYRSSIALPVTDGDGTAGAVSVYAENPGVFDEEVVALLGELAADLSFALASSAADLAMRRQAALIDLSPDAIIVRRLDGTITFWGRGAEALYGWSSDEALGHVSHELLRSRLPEPLPAIEERLQRSGRWSGEVLHRAKDGSEIVVRSRCQVHRGPGGNVAEVLESNVDVTELRGAARALEESEERYRQLVELCPDAIVVHSEGRLILANSAARKVLGADDPAGWLGRPILDFVHPESRPVVAERVRLMLEEGADVPLIAERFLRVDGTPIDVEVAAGPLTFQGRQAVQVVFRDVTERKRAEEALRESELHFRTLAETAGIGIVITQDNRFTYANREAERLTGYVLEEMRDFDFWDIVHPDHRDLVRQRALARLNGASDIPSRYEVKGIVKGGEVRWFGLTSGRISLSGKPALVATIADITEERRLREVQSALYQLSEATQTASDLDELFAAIHRIVGRLMDAKNLYIALHDPATDLVSFPYFVDEVDSPPAPFPLGRGMTGYVLRSGQPLLATPEVLRDLEARGELEPLGAPSIDWLGVPLKAQDTIIGVLAVQSYAGAVRYSEADKLVLGYISAHVAQAIARKQAEEAVRESQRMRLVGQLAGGIAHDFNNLLQALLGSVDVLRTRASDPSVASRALAGMEEDIRRAAALTRQLLLFSRREVGKVEPLDLNEVVRQASTLLRRLLRENIRVMLELAEGPLRVDADRGQMEQVLVNLAVNAADAMAGGGQLTIRSGRAGEGEIFLEVEDTGAGMSQEVQVHIFEPFFTTKGKEKGVGLGLSVVHGIVSQHRGRIEVASEPGSGTRFRIVLPGRAWDAVAPQVERPREQTGSVPRGGERILLVEDELGSRQAVDDVLRLLGYDVVTVASGEEAAGLPDGRPFDLLLTDMLLPGIHGGELATRMRERWPGLKVILMSGYAEDEAVRRLVDGGSVRFLQKPFGMSVLATEIRAALAEP